MSYILQSPSHGNIQFSSDIPKQFSELAQPGGSAWSAIKDFGDIFVQAFTGKEFSCKWHYYFPKEEISIVEDLEGPSIQLCIVIDGLQLEQMIDDIGEVQLSEWQYYLMYVPRGAAVTSQFKKGRGGRHFTMRFSVRLFMEIAGQVPLSGDVLRPLEHTTNCFLFGGPGRITPRILDIISTLFNQDFKEEDQKEYYYELKATEIIWHLLVEKTRERDSPIHQKDLEAVLKAKQVILENLTAPLSERELARRVRLNVFKLKKLFKEVMGETMYEFIITSRLGHARATLLNTNKTIKEIAAESGYHSTDSFTTAFRKRFLMTPDALRKKLM